MDKKKIGKFISFLYIAIAYTIFAIAVGLFIWSTYVKEKDIKAEVLLSKVMSKERYISPDQISDKIINQDPSIQLIDVRDSKSFNSYSLPNAINISLPELFNEEHQKIIDQEQFDIVFISNGHILSDQAWILCSRKGLKNMSVLKGGLNEWFETIINPGIPLENMPEKDFILYSERKAASMYFGVAYPDLFKKKTVRTTPKKVVTVKKKKKKPTEGGC